MNKASIFRTRYLDVLMINVILWTLQISQHKYIFFYSGSLKFLQVVMSVCLPLCLCVCVIAWIFWNHQTYRDLQKWCPKVTSKSPKVKKSKSDVKKRWPKVTSKSKYDVLKWCPKMTSKSGIQKWHLKGMFKNYVPKWCLKVMSKSYAQKLCLKVTSEGVILKLGLFYFLK